MFLGMESAQMYYTQLVHRSLHEGSRRATVDNENRWLVPVTNYIYKDKDIQKDQQKTRIHR